MKKTHARNVIRYAGIVVATALAAAGFTACAGTGGSSQTATSITVWDPNYKSSDKVTAASDAVDKAFTAKTGIKVKRVAQPFSNYDQLLQAAFTGKEGPDVMLMLPGAQGVLRYKDGLVDLDNDVKDIRDQVNFWAATSPTFSDKGATYGVPVGSAGILFYYNKDLFTKAGLDPDKPPTTMDELLSDVAALKAAGIVPIGSGNKEGYENQWYFSAMWAGANDVKSSEELAKNDVKMTDPRIEAALKEYQSLQDAGAFPTDRFSTPLFPDGGQTFKDGKAAMFLGLSDVTASWQEFNESLGVDKVGYFQTPGVDGEAKQLPVTASYVWSVPTFTKNRDAAIKYVNFAGTAEAQQIQYDKSQAFPNNTTVKLPDAPPQLVGMMKDYADRPTYQSAHQLWPGAVLTAYTTQMNEVLQGRMKLDDMLASLQTTFDQSVKK